MVKLEKIHAFIRSNKIPYKFLCDFTGFSAPHISNTLNGRKSLSNHFFRLLSLAIKEYMQDDEETLSTIKDELWKYS